MKKIIIFLQIITVITLLVLTVNGGAETGKNGKYFLMIATAYYPGIECCYPFHDGLTATGAKAGKGCIAVDPKAGILKMGQKVYVENYGYGICNDVGEAIKGWKIDLCFDTYQEALNWGRKLVRVYIIKEDK